MHWMYHAKPIKPKMNKQLSFSLHPKFGSRHTRTFSISQACQDNPPFSGDNVVLMGEIRLGSEGCHPNEDRYCGQVLCSIMYDVLLNRVKF